MDNKEGLPSNLNIIKIQESTKGGKVSDFKHADIVQRFDLLNPSKSDFFLYTTYNERTVSWYCEAITAGIFVVFFLIFSYVLLYMEL